ncbi:MAG: zinc ribbon domain-containing protein [Actinomycetota bacterium]|nr:zinc ribbon domain-containing protein [Actinomycetota bacterium]
MTNVAGTSVTAVTVDTPLVDLRRRHAELLAKVAELQWDLGGLVYEMAIRDSIRVNVITRQAAALQDVEAQLAEIDRILKHEAAGTAGTCGSCGAPHSANASFCWQCGAAILRLVDHGQIFADAATPDG